MTSQITILDAGASPLSGSPAASGLRYLSALAREGARSFVDNADVAVEILVVGDRALPLVVSRGRRGNSAVCSPHAHYVRYVAEARARRHPAIPAACFHALGLPMSLISRVGRFDEVAYVNNWLWNTNPKPRLTAAEIGALTARLTARHPQAAILLRSVNPELDRPTFDALRRSGYRLIRSREVFVLDTGGGRHLAHANSRRDAVFLNRTAYEIVRSPERLGAEAPRIAALYRDLNLVKYPALNPQFNTRFFELTIREEVLSYFALAADGGIDAFMASFVEDDVVTSSLVGYDRELPRDRGLYRLVMAQLIADAAARGLRLNLGSGAASFKRLRGAHPVTEFDAVYDRHLARPRRLAWACLALAANRHGREEPRTAGDSFSAESLRP
ncbi:MAG: GNAT family N-acetyltransferase [Candidatus Binatia bacterium]